MRAVFDPSQRSHEPELMLVRGVVAPSQERPERVDRLLSALERCGADVRAPEDFGPGPRLAVHSREYLDFLETALGHWAALGDASAQVVPNVHPRGPHATYPEAIVGRAGWHMLDTAAPIGPGTYEAACASANSALTAAQLVLRGEPFAYGLCRPPGHHAGADTAGGFCYLNNAAIAAEHLRRSLDRVAVLDVDVHHGNGTQSIFYSRRDVLTVSIHADPRHFYPFYWGHEHERGAGPGLGFNRNLPLPIRSGDDAFMAALAQAVEAVRAFEPGALVVALGLDASASDPLHGLAVTAAGFRRAGAAIAALGLPSVYVQEGGYLSDALTESLVAFLDGVMGA